MQQTVYVGLDLGSSVCYQDAHQFRWQSCSLETL